MTPSVWHTIIRKLHTLGLIIKVTTTHMSLGETMITLKILQKNAVRSLDWIQNWVICFWAETLGLVTCSSGHRGMQCDLISRGIRFIIYYLEVLVYYLVISISTKHGLRRRGHSRAKFKKLTPALRECCLLFFF